MEIPGLAGQVAPMLQNGLAGRLLSATGMAPWAQGGGGGGASEAPGMAGMAGGMAGGAGPLNLGGGGPASGLDPTQFAQLLEMKRRQDLMRYLQMQQMQQQPGQMPQMGGGMM
jgi:hypothetical protein